MRVIAALVFVCTAAITVPALAQNEGNPTTTTTTTPVQVAVPAPPPCTPLRQLYARKNWRDAHPLRGENPCKSPNARKLKAAFFLYRHYRLIAPYRGFNEGDPYLKWLAIPAYIVACETQGYYGRGRWFAANASGAVGPYQLLGWNAPYPARTAGAKVRNHEIAASLGLSNWACA